MGVETWGGGGGGGAVLGADRNGPMCGVRGPEKQQSSWRLQPPPPSWHPRPGWRGSRAATGPTEGFLSAWSCAQFLRALSHFIPWVGLG